MKSLIVLLALVAWSKADESIGAYEQCLNETLRFKSCAENNLAHSARDVFQEIANLTRELLGCLQQDGVKDQCKLPGHPELPPALPPHPQAANQSPPAPAGPRPIPSPDARAAGNCLRGVESAFVSCFVNASGIPSDVVKAVAERLRQQQGGFGPGGLPPFGGPGGPAAGGPRPGGPPGPGGLFFGGPGFIGGGLGGPGGPHPVQGHFINGSLAEIKEKTLQICNGNQDAANKLLQCGLGIAKKHFDALFTATHSLSLVCSAVKACQAESPISADCQAKLQKAAAGFKTCVPQVQQLLTSNKDCAAIQPPAGAPQPEAHQQFPEPGALKSLCEDLKQKQDAIRAKLDAKQ